MSIACLWQDGGLFTFGDGSWGQLGHGSTNNELLPRRVLELMGTEVSQITCGRYSALNLKCWILLKLKLCSGCVTELLIKV